MTQVAIATAFFSYIIGSFPTAYLFGKKYLHRDIHKVGTRNLGAYNVFQSVGWLQGLVTLLVDALKGYVPVMLAILLDLSTFWIGTCASLALIGHNWSVFTGFKGGKGGSTSAGILFALFPKHFTVIFVFFMLLVALTKNLSFGIGLSILFFPFLLVFSSQSAELIVLASVIPIIGLIRLSPFIRRMLMASKGNFKHMLFIILKGFEKYEQICQQKKPSSL